mmetsp:Transcript_108176/g.316326  ORF Transcript_108176/g.316326 Transcript_108176/m.316326 type:complete len:222 (+) Transcript_108176:1306-1971(+)
MFICHGTCPLALRKRSLTTFISEADCWKATTRSTGASFDTSSMRNVTAASLESSVGFHSRPGSSSNQQVKGWPSAIRSSKADRFAKWSWIMPVPVVSPSWTSSWGAHGTGPTGKIHSTSSPRDFRNIAVWNFMMLELEAAPCTARARSFLLAAAASGSGSFGGGRERCSLRSSGRPPQRSRGWRSSRSSRAVAPTAHASSTSPPLTWTLTFCSRRSDLPPM